MKKLLLGVLIIVTFGFQAKAQNVNIPDANFKAYLVGNSSINTNADTSIQVVEANAFAGIVACANVGISDLTGIEEFTNMTELWCSGNQLTSLDVSANTALTNLRCFNNDIVSLDLSTNINLVTLYCASNKLIEINVSANTSLAEIVCSNNKLTSLNVANGNNLNFVDFGAHTNPNLTCINVDNVAYSTANWIDIDNASSFSVDCATVGVDEQTHQVSLIVYPNPVSHQLTIANLQSPMVNVTILDLTGKMVKSIRPNSNTIDVSNLISGVYFIQIQTEEGVFNNKFIKE